MADLLADVLAAAATASETHRGKLLWRVNGHECRLTAPDTMVITGSGTTLVTRIEGVDLMEALS